MIDAAPMSIRRPIAWPALAAALLLMPATGADALQTAQVGDNLYPRWSPDGSRIVFQSTRDGNEEIYVMDADGSGQSRLTRNIHSDRQAAWSADGRSIVFQSMRGNAFSGRLDSDIYVMAADGSGQRVLIGNAGPEITPRPSPDGRYIAYAVGTIRNFTLMVANADGSSPRAFDDLPSDAGNPAWSPDSEWIYFDTAAPIPPRYDLRAVRRDGSQVVDVTGGAVRAFFPAISPDGRSLAFGIATGPDGEEWNIGIADIDGGNLRLLADSPGYDGWPDWSPDGRRLAFSSRRTGSMQIFVVNADGTGLTQLTGG